MNLDGVLDTVGVLGFVAAVLGCWSHVVLWADRRLLAKEDYAKAERQAHAGWRAMSKEERVRSNTVVIADVQVWGRIRSHSRWLIPVGFLASAVALAVG